MFLRLAGEMGAPSTTEILLHGGRGRMLQSAFCKSSLTMIILPPPHGVLFLLASPIHLLISSNAKSRGPPRVTIINVSGI